VGLRRKQPTSPDNAATAVIPVFTQDPRGAAMFAGILNGTLGQLGSRVVMDTQGTGKSHGWAQNPQGNMTGAANIGGARPSVPTTTRFERTQDVAPDSVQALFAQRSSERRLS
jgi:hypothetical protein